ncbi:MAG TPA: hypothetical protein VHZ51_18820, partial [Ktedonobacteraceae bacterium]|nr:hypothetical protein [Ktedonobacteraceae bacterium]
MARSRRLVGTWLLLVHAVLFLLAIQNFSIEIYTKYIQATFLGLSVLAEQVLSPRLLLDCT